MELFEIFALAVTGSFCAVSLKKYAPEISAVIAVSAGALILTSLLGKFTPIVEEINTLVSSAGISTEYGTVLLKTVGICFICQFTSDACRDCGQSSIASKVELASKLSIVLISLPLFKTILDTVSALLTNTNI